MAWWTWALILLIVLPSAAGVWLSVALGLRLEERREAESRPAPPAAPSLLEDAWEPAHDARPVAVHGSGRLLAGVARAACRRAKLAVRA